jgi:hypothetical protein
MIEIEQTCTDQFRFALANTTDPTVIVMPIRAYAEMQAASQAAFANAALVYIVVSLIIGGLVGAGLMWLYLKDKRNREEEDQDDPGVDE